MTEYVSELTKIKWRCRRGMLELDIFLLPFCENIYSSLNLEEKNIFIDLLNENDVDLFEWLMNRCQSDKSQFNHLIQLIRAHRLGQ